MSKILESKYRDESHYISKLKDFSEIVAELKQVPNKSSAVQAEVRAVSRNEEEGQGKLREEAL